MTVLTCPTAPAVKDARQNVWLSYYHLNQRANALARCLLRRLRGTAVSNPDGDRIVAICMAPTSHLVTCLLAIHKAGAAYLPLDVTFPESRVAHILQDARPALLLAHGRPRAVQAAQAALQLDNNVPVLHLEDLHTEMESENDEELNVREVGLTMNGSSIAMILYTSGSTGVPKGVRLSHRAALNRLAWQWQTFAYQKDEVCCFKTALTFVDSISEIFGPLLSGRPLVIIPKAVTQAVDELVNVLERESVGRLVLVPTLLRSIILYCSEPQAPKLKNLRLWVCSGEVFPPDLLTAFFAAFADGQTICNFYGSTEVLGDVTAIQFQRIEDSVIGMIDKKVPIGFPIANCRIYLLNGEGNPVSEGQIGEIFAAGLNLSSGYVGGAQQDKFVSNTLSQDPDYKVLYRTGDFGRVVGGKLFYEGRTDSQVKVRGHRVDLSEIEAALQKLEEVDKVYILVYKPGEINQALVAFYTSNDEGMVPEKIALKLASLLQPYMQPQLVYLDDLPLLVNGKVDRQTLLKMYENESEGETEDLLIDLTGVEAERRPAARALLLTVGRVVGVSVTRGSPLSIKDSFFEVGGNSLNSVLTVTSLQDRGYHIGIGEFLKASTLGEVLDHMQQLEVEDVSEGNICPKVKDVQEYECFPLDFSHKEVVFSLISESFAKKGDLEMWLHTEPWEYQQLLEPLFSTLVEKDLSFVVMRQGTEEVVAVALNFDLHDEPVVEDISPKLAYVLGFLEECEAPQRSKLPQGIGNVIHSFMMGTLLELGPVENVVLIQIMEKENLTLAKKRGYKAVFTTNTSGLTQQVCDDLLSYKVLADYQVNLWVAPDGTKPFKDAPNTQRAVTTVKYI
ncbi:beta-alanyl-bioamine nonribosomal peptide synthetase ebony-like [Penaeus indicus]|uniref:beta-alanyl-bioamine nonribosomal peptide synthetase ebony-like n=1 Tax=Penaeus indicus TaxID=29960 RepID=UPI00300CBD0D